MSRTACYVMENLCFDFGLPHFWPKPASPGGSNNLGRFIGRFVRKVDPYVNVSGRPPKSHPGALW